MCRLFAYVTPHASTMDSELDARGFQTLERLAKLHGDGWGWAGVSEPGRWPALLKSPHSAVADPGFRSALGIPARGAMLHLRWATLGGVRPENTHPFLVDGMAFEHNGSIRPHEQIEALLSRSSLGGIKGQTDSELYMALIRENMAIDANVAAAALRSVRRLRLLFPHSSLNAILLTSQRMVVVHASARSVLPDDDIEEIKRHDLPSEHLDDYYALRWLRKPDGSVLIGSTGVAGPDWTPLPSESVVSISLVDCQVSIATISSVQDRQAVVG